jgi:hypothetical protein
MMIQAANRSLTATAGGNVTVTLRLNNAARRALAKKHRLAVDITVSYSQSNEVDVASLTLTTALGKAKHAAKQVPTRRSGTPRRARKR